MDRKRANMSMRIPRRLLQRVCVWFSVRMGVTAKDCVDAVKLAFGCGMYSRSTIYLWHKAFRSGHTKLGDFICTGAPQRACTCRRIRRCKVLVEQNRNVCVEELSRTLGISQGSTHRILRKDLNLRKKSAKLVPHRLTPAQCRQRRLFCKDFLRRARRLPNFLSWVATTDEAWFYLTEIGTKQENMQWLQPTDNRPQVPRQSRGCKKLMVIPFFDRRGLLHVEFYYNQTINQTLFRMLVEDVWQHFRVRRFLPYWNQRYCYLLHMDNAPAHRGDTVHRTLDALEWRRLPHPPYSPDLSPCDFFLFPLLKKRLRGRDFWSVQLLELAIRTELGNITQMQWRHCFVDWVRRCRKCIAFNGSYFEGMKHAP